MRAGPLVLLLLVHAALVLGGVYFMLVQFGDELDRRVDKEVTAVELQVKRDLDDVKHQVARRFTRELQRELDARLPSTGQP